jgi:hypothetical protein
MTNRTDDFNRTADPLGAPSDDGSIWVRQDGYGWSANGTTAQKNGADGAVAAVLESSVADVEVQVTITSFTQAGVVGRYVNSTNYYFFQALAGTGYKIQSYIAGSYANVGSLYSATPASGDVLKLKMVGTTFQGYVNGVLRCSGTSAPLSTATAHGLFNVNDTGVRYDNFSITEVAGGSASLPAIAMHNFKMMRG